LRNLTRLGFGTTKRVKKTTKLMEEFVAPSAVINPDGGMDELKYLGFCRR
jgi:hypothetical protein